MKSGACLLLGCAAAALGFQKSPVDPAGVGMSYNYLHRTMFGFTNGMPGMVVMPVVGPWTVPPERSESVYDKSKEKASPGYYTVYLDDFRVKAEMTATFWTGIYRHLPENRAVAHPDGPGPRWRRYRDRGRPDR